MALKLIECPRDAWQGLKHQIPTDTKVQYLRALIGTGFKHLDAVSFVSPKAVPQMADSEQVLKNLDPPDDVEIIAIVVNEKGADRAIATDAVRTLGFPYSISPTFLKNNQNQTLEESIDVLEKIEEKARDAGLGLVVYVSMAFGNPYGDLWSIEEVTEAVDLLSEMQVEQVSLADTVGLASPHQITDLAAPVIERFRHLEIGVHLHSRPADVKEKVKAAYNAGCRRFDSAIGGLGGCPFAQDELVGNLATEDVLETLRELGVESPIRKPLETISKMSQSIALGSPSPRIQ
jgi:hydroxymethylglutaryl-CoA lyase